MKMFKRISQQLGTLLLFMLPGMVLASTGGDGATAQDFTNTSYGILAVAVFVIAYAFVIGEEAVHLKKSIPVIIGAGIIWTLVGLAYSASGDTHFAASAVEHNILEFGELFLFLLAAMTFINTMEERQVFDALRAALVSRGFSMRTIFWITGVLAFLISPIADNLTTALLMAAVVMAVGKGNNRFVAIACVNIVVAANAGGAFSPFGDITTLMVWQKGMVQFSEFFALFVPSVVNWVIPAFIMSLAVPKDIPEKLDEEVRVLHGGYQVIILFLLTIGMAVMSHNFLHMPPVLGMMTGLGLLKLYGYYLQHGAYYRLYAKQALKKAESVNQQNADEHADLDLSDGHYGETVHRSDKPPSIHGAEVNGVNVTKSGQSEEDALSADLDVMRKYDVYNIVARAEWDTLMFFYGVVLCVGGLATLGYLAVASEAMYADLGPTWANVIVGVLSAVVDNIPVMFAVLTMSPEMGLDQWLLVTLTAGVGGSLLSVGSAAGVALMGQARGVYTFFAHLKWTWAIALGYAGSIMVHLAMNSDMPARYVEQNQTSKTQSAASQTEHDNKKQHSKENAHAETEHSMDGNVSERVDQITERTDKYVSQVKNHSESKDGDKKEKLISVIMDTNWRYRNKPIGYLPSKITFCEKSVNNTINCKSGKQRKSIDNKVITYITSATLYKFKNNRKFTIRYTNNVLSVENIQNTSGNDQQRYSVPTGLRKTSSHRLICNLANNSESEKTIRCVKNKSHTLVFKS